MKAISLWQPWASLMAFREKKNETRSWPTKYRGPLAIHATASMNKESRIICNTDSKFISALAENGIGSWKELPFGAVLGHCNLIDCIPVHEYLDTHSIKYKEYHFGDYRMGRFVWVTRDFVKYEEPIPAKGAQGFWNWDEKAA